MPAKTLGVTGILYTDRRNFYISPNEYASLYANRTPLLSDLMDMWLPRNGTAPDETYKMFEYRSGVNQQYFDANGAASWSGTGTPGETATVTVDGATGIGDNNNTIDASLIGREVMIWTSGDGSYKGNALVTAVNSTTEIVLKVITNPASSTETISAIADNDRIYVIGGNFGEGSEAPEAASDELEVVWNSIFYHRTSLELTSSIMNAALRGETDELSRLQTGKAVEHKVQANRKLYLSARRGGMGGTAHGAGGGTDAFSATHITDADGKRVPNSMGIVAAFLRYGRTSGDQQNVFSFSQAGATYNDLLDAADKAYQYNPTGERKRWYGGPGFHSFWQKLGSEGLLTKSSKARMEIKVQGTNPTSIGNKVDVVSFGTYEFEIVKDESLRFTPFTNWAHCLDMSNVAIVYYPFTLASTGETTTGNGYFPNIKKDNNPMIRKDEYVSAMGLRLTLMETHSQWKAL